MIEFAFFVNGDYIDRVKAVRVDGEPGGICTYDVYFHNTKFQVKHFYDHGAWKLMEIVAREIVRRGKIESKQDQN